MNNPIYIEANQVEKSFEGRPVLRGMTFDVPQGAVVGLLGPNGSGKTTMIRLLNGVIDADRGAMRVGGYDPARDGDAVRRLCGIVTEGAALYHEMSGEDNLRFFSKLYGVCDESRIRELLEQFDLAQHGSKAAGTYSTGMKKRLALAKALLHRPPLLFLDEPTNGLDPEGTRLVLNYLKRLNEREGTTIFICSHVLHQLETVCDRYIFMEKGRIIEAGTAQAIEAKYRRSVELVVETGAAIRGESYAGYPVQRVGSGDRYRFILPSKDAIADLLRKLLQESWVHTAEIVNRDLESLYFEVRKVHVQ